jgi:membrane associated rhomboid family serine protease
MPYSSSYGSGFRGSLTPWVFRLLVLNTVVFIGTIFVHLFGPDVTGWLALQPSLLLRQPWTIVTYAFTHRLDVIGWLLSSLMIFFLGPRLEDRWGGKGFLQYLAAAVLGGAVGAVALSAAMRHDFPLAGSTVIVDGLFLAWALFWPREEILFFGIFPIQIRWLFLGILGISVLQQAAGGMVGFLFLVPMAASMGACYALLQSPWAPRGWGDLPKQQKKPTRRPQQRAVVPWSGGAKESPAQPAAPRQPAATGARRTARSEKDLLDDVDRILDKISAQGLSSLTEEERKRLDEVSRRYRTN